LEENVKRKRKTDSSFAERKLVVALRSLQELSRTQGLIEHSF